MTAAVVLVSAVRRLPVLLATVSLRDFRHRFYCRLSGYKLSARDGHDWFEHAAP